MDSFGVLLTVAEVGIGLAGFGGIAAGLGYRVHSNWSPEDRMRLIFSATTSLQVVFASLVPYVVFEFSSDRAELISGWLLLPLVLFNLGIQAAVFGRGVPQGYNRAASWVLFVAQLFTLAALVVLLTGLIPGAAFGCYLLAVLGLLFQAALLFVRLLVTSFRERTAGAGD